MRLHGDAELLSVAAALGLATVREAELHTPGPARASLPGSRDALRSRL